MDVSSRLYSGRIQTEAILNPQRLRRRDDCLLGGFAVRAPHLTTDLATIAAQMPNDERGHPLFLSSLRSAPQTWRIGIEYRPLQVL
jgi:hypothetical protein